MIITLKGADFSGAGNNIGNLSQIGGTFTFTINPTPSDATVKINGTARKSITGAYGTAISWEVSKDGYNTRTGSLTMPLGGKTMSVSLTAVGSVTPPVTPDPEPDQPGTGGGSGDSGNREFTLTSSMLTNQTYSTSTSSWKDSTKHLGTGFMTLYSGYDVVFDLPDTMEGYVAHLYQEKDGTNINSKISLLSSWVQKGIVSTGPTSDKYFIVIQKKSKAVITPDEYASIVGSIKVQKPTARTITLDNTLMNAGKGYMAVNIIDDPDRMASWFYALTPGSTVSGNIADGLQAYIMSIRENDKEFSVDTSWVPSFNQTYNEACSIYIVAKYTDGSDFADTSSWTSPLTINIK